MAVRGLHKQWAELGRRALEVIPREERDISGTTLGLTRKAYEAQRGEIKELRRKAAAVAASEPGTERVYQLVVHLFPVSRPHSERRSQSRRKVESDV